MLEVNDRTNCISDRLIRTDGRELVAKKDEPSSCPGTILSEGRRGVCVVLKYRFRSVALLWGVLLALPLGISLVRAETTAMSVLAEINGETITTAVVS